MANVQIIRRRIKSVKNINQITKAMEMVAASKLKKVQDAATRSRIYAAACRDALSSIRHATSFQEHAFFQERPVRHELIIMLSSDRGLAGAYNSNILKELIRVIEENNAHGISEHSLIAIGKRGAQFISRIKGVVDMKGVYTGWQAHPDFEDVRPIIATVVNLFLEQKIDRVRLLYTNFISISRQRVVTHQLLPVAANVAQEQARISDSIVEPSIETVLEYVLPRFLEVQLYQAALEASASEQAMRMIAMKNASDNAKDLRQDLSLLFNRARQASITQEIAEIISGVQAVTS
ncbi:MAG TPA: ATP synthase F1 subunit gamma [Candidatus Andersenbacteria bacterium]|nr:ATP synthase F1 subunit gamma [Candidatus Andersenbacteria bacterium]